MVAWTDIADITPREKLDSQPDGKLNLLLANQRYLRGEPWIAVLGGIGFQNSWQNIAGAGLGVYYRREGDGVRFKGTMRTGASGDKAFTLPAGYRPTVQRVVLCVTSGGVGSVIVEADGDFFPYQLTGSISTSCYLDGIWIPVT